MYCITINNNACDLGLDPNIFRNNFKQVKKPKIEGHSRLQSQPLF